MLYRPSASLHSPSVHIKQQQNQQQPKKNKNKNEKEREENKINPNKTFCLLYLELIYWAWKRKPYMNINDSLPATKQINQSIKSTRSLSLSHSLPHSVFAYFVLSVLTSLALYFIFWFAFSPFTFLLPIPLNRVRFLLLLHSFTAHLHFRSLVAPRIQQHGKIRM